MKRISLVIASTAVGALLCVPTAGAATGPGLIAKLNVKGERNAGYDRDLFDLWIDADSNGCDTRDEVLYRQNRDRGRYCGSSRGIWKSAYDGLRFTDSSLLDVDHFVPTDSSELRAQLGLADKAVIISVGRLVHRKGQDKLISALPAIRAAVPNVHLVLVGVGPHQKYLENLVAKLNIADCVTFIGRINYSELPKYICVGDIFAMPSRSRFFGLEVEGLGIVYLEASACGLPVVGGKSGGAPDAVLVGETGVVVDGTNSSEIAEACIDLLNNPELCALMGATGRTWIIENWRWEIWATKYAELLA